MQRQSLGAPGSKHHPHPGGGGGGGGGATTTTINVEEGDDESQRRRRSSSGGGSIKSLRGGERCSPVEEDVLVATEDEAKPGKPARSGNHRSIHLIPLLTLLCFLVLYLFSRDPAPKGVGAAGFGGLDGGLDVKVSKRRYVVAAEMRSQRLLKEAEMLRAGGGRKFSGGGRLLHL